jgi:putative ABC transport system substrate-binding protein
LQDLTPAPFYDVTLALSSIAGDIDVVYVPADNTAMAAAATIVKVADKFGVPTFAGDPGTFRAGAVVGLGVSYYDLGVQTAELALKILVNKANPGELPVAVVKNPKLMINKKKAHELGFTIPAKLIERANEVIEE